MKKVSKTQWVCCILGGIALGTGHLVAWGVWSLLFMADRIIEKHKNVDFDDPEFRNLCIKAYLAGKHGTKIEK